jgi:hypothetical protein
MQAIESCKEMRDGSIDFKGVNDYTLFFFSFVKLTLNSLFPFSNSLSYHICVFIEIGLEKRRRNFFAHVIQSATGSSNDKKKRNNRKKTKDKEKRERVNV